MRRSSAGLRLPPPAVAGRVSTGFPIVLRRARGGKSLVFIVNYRTFLAAAFKEAAGTLMKRVSASPPAYARALGRAYVRGR